MIGGLSVGTWFEMYWGTHEPTGMGTIRMREWLEPGGFGDQPTLAIDAMGMVEEAIMKQAERDRQSG